MRGFAGRVLRDAASGFADHNGMTLAASIAFYTALSLAPALILGLWAAASVSPNAQGALVAEVGALAGEDARAAVELVIRNASRRPSLGSLAGIAGILISVVSASAVFSQLQTALNIVWSVEPERAAESRHAVWAWLCRRLLSIGILAAFTFILIVSLIVSTALELIIPHTGTLWTAANQLIGLVVFTVLFAAIFRYLPDRRLSWHDTWGGALATAILFSLGKYAIGEYLARTTIAGSYGPAGSLAVILVWVYYSAILFLFGAELVRAFVAGRAPAA